MTDLEERIKKVLDEECFELYLKPCPLDSAKSKVYECWECHKHDTLAVRLAEEVKRK